MKQADLGLHLTTKRTRKREFLAEMERVVPWVALVALIAPYALKENVAARRLQWRRGSVTLAAAPQR